ncbi:MAG: NAD/NADP octopine/nopaline dehydrogenase family protein [Hyphomicrobiales bacterium]
MATRPDSLPWVVIGGGNGGQSLAGHLGLMGHTVRMVDVMPETVAAIQSQGGIALEGQVRGFGQVELATHDPAEAIPGAGIIVVVTPAHAHRDVARSCAPFLSDGQVVFLHPGATGGALEFRNVLHEEGCLARIAILESDSLIYACRSPQPGRASILGVKKDLLVAALPAVEGARPLRMLQAVFPQIRAGRNVLETSLGNPNAMVHPAPTVLNTSLIESGRDWLYYWDGMTPSIGAFVESMDQERLAVAEALGLRLPTIREWYRLAYAAEGATLTQAVRNNRAYAKIRGQKTLRTRYLMEDIPMGLLPMVSIGKMIGVDVQRMETILNLAQFLTGENFASTGRTVERLGLTGMSPEQITAYVETGAR